NLTLEDHKMFCEIHYIETTIVPDAYSKSQVDYLLEVLVPETALHLMSQDRGNIELEDARKIMDDSSTFGDYIHADLTN
ncbi:5986_t:CDS:2, partial [Cetraspora pellucida]